MVGQQAGVEGTDDADPAVGDASASAAALAALLGDASGPVAMEATALW